MRFNLREWLSHHGWANYLAMDKSGEIFVYDLTPTRSSSYWVTQGGKQIKMPQHLWTEAVRIYGITIWEDSRRPL